MLNIRIMRKFDKLYEAYYDAYCAGIYAPGQVLKFDLPKLKKHHAFKEMSDQQKQRLLDMVEASEAGEAVICVVDRDGAPWVHNMDRVETLTIGISQGGGRYSDIMTIRGSLGDCITVLEDPIGNQISTIPPSNRIDYPARTYPQEIDTKKLEKNRFNPVASSIFDTVQMDLDLKKTAQK